MELINNKTGIVEYSGNMTAFKGIEAYVNDEYTADDFTIKLTKSEKKHALQAEIAKSINEQSDNDQADLSELKITTALSLAGKTSNALSGSLNTLMQVLGGLAQAQTLADVRNAVVPAVPLMTQVQSLVDKGEIMSVQYAQGISDVDAVIEGLQAISQAAKIIKAQQPATV